MIISENPQIEIEKSWAGLKTLQFSPFNVIFPYYNEGELVHFVMLSHEGKTLVEVGEGYSFPRQQTPITPSEWAVHVPTIHKHFKRASTVAYWAYPIARMLEARTPFRSPDWLMDTTWFSIREIAQDYNKWDAPESIDSIRRKMDIIRPNIKTGERDQGKDAYGYAHLLLHITNKLLMYRR